MINVIVQNVEQSHSHIISVTYRRFQNYAATTDKTHGMKVAMDCRQSNKYFTWICLISIQSLLKLSFVITDAGIVFD